MKKFLSFLFLLTLSTLYGQVTMKVTPGNAVLENKYLKAVFANPGGRMTQFIDKATGKDLVLFSSSDSTGACKDQIPPIDYSFRQSDYVFTVLKNTPEVCSFRVTSNNRKMQWKFQKISREFTLCKDQSVLHGKVILHNQLENMAPVTMQYWMHGYFGVKGEANQFSCATENGIERFVPSDASNRKLITNPVRGWLSMLGKKGNGVILIPEFKRLHMVYSWYCKAAEASDTMEFRLRAAEIPEGSSLTSPFYLAVAANLPQISGAGAAGEGFLSVGKNGMASVKLSGFRNQNVTLELVADGKVLARKAAQFKTGKLTSYLFNGVKISANTGLLSVRILAGKQFLFDLLHPIKSKELVALEKRVLPAGAEEPWQYQFSDGAPLPFYRWSNAKDQPEVLCMLPVNGIRDVIELKKRRPMKTTIPVLFPNSYQMSWRINTTIPNVNDKTGCDQIPQFLKNRKYDAFIIGSRVTSPWGPKGISWQTFPVGVRKELLRRVHAGAGLIIVKPHKPDAVLQKLLNGAKNITAEVAKKMHFGAAPYFDRTQILEAVHGKGRIIFLKYPHEGYLLPRPGGRVITFRAFEVTHRFQEYQLAIFANLFDRVCRKTQNIRSLTAKDSKVTIRLNKPGKVKFTVFDPYTVEGDTITKTLNAGTSTVDLSSILMHTENYIHVTCDSGDFAYTLLNNKRSPRIRRVNFTRTPQGIRANANSMGAGKLQWKIFDCDDRITAHGSGKTAFWNTKNAVSNFHTLEFTLSLGNKIVDRKRIEFNLPEVFHATKNFANLLWSSGDNLPEYIYPGYWKLFRKMGFNFQYAGSGAEHSYLQLLKYSPIEAGCNWCGPYFFHSNENIAKWQKTHDKKYLAKKGCPNNPAVFDHKTAGLKNVDAMASFGTRHLFQLGDEMSITYYNTPFDSCICQYCLKDFRVWLNKRHGSLKQLNAAWKTSFKKWDDVKPMTRVEILTHDSPAPWVEHRLYMDHVFCKALMACQTNIQKKHPGAIVGPTGVNNPPHTYGGNWNFRNMSKLGCVSTYGPARLPVSFDRDKRLIMSYHGYSNAEGTTRYQVWENICLGGRSTNNWFAHTFIMPNLECSPVRKFYSDLMWELRSGTADLLFHSSKVQNTAGIYFSQNSLIANFLKQRKTDYWQKALSFAVALEDLGIPHRFIAKDEINDTFLRQYKVIFLPEASALTDQECEMFIRYVKNGGKIIADYDAGTLDALSNRRRKNLLHPLFGIRTMRTRLRPVEQAVKETGIDMDRVMDGTRLNGGKAMAYVSFNGKKIPCNIVRKTGKGMTLYLNYSHNYSEQRGTKEGRTFLRLLDRFMNIAKPVQLKTDYPVMHNFYQNGATQYIVLLPIHPKGNWKKMTAAQFDKKSFNTALTLLKECYLYDAATGKAYGKNRNFTIRLTPGRPSILAALPYAIKLQTQIPSAAKRGDSIAVKAMVPGGKHHVFRCRVKMPDGTYPEYYHQIRNTTNGAAEFPIHFAWNAPRGQWTIELREAASGITVTRKITLK